MYINTWLICQLQERVSPVTPMNKQPACAEYAHTKCAPSSSEDREGVSSIMKMQFASGSSDIVSASIFDLLIIGLGGSTSVSFLSDRLPAGFQTANIGIFL